MLRILNRLKLPGGLCSILMMLFAANAAAADGTLHASLVDFLQSQVAATAGEASVTVTMPDMPLAPCNAPQPFLPRRTTDLSGAVTVAVKCPGNTPLTRYFRAYIAIKTAYFVAAHPLETGIEVTPGDLQRVVGDITQLAPGVVTDPAQVVGMLTSRRIAQGLPLTKRMVHEANAIARGDHVRVVAQGDGFTITTTGTALSSAPAGGRVRVRTSTGTVVTGVSRSPNRVFVRL